MCMRFLQNMFFIFTVLFWSGRKKRERLYFSCCIENDIFKFDSFLLFLILSSICFQCVSGTYIHAINEKNYKIIVNLIRYDANFDIPKNVRTSAHRSAYVKYWRVKKVLSLNDNGKILFQWRRVWKGELNQLWIKE